ncbi:hypothetical protein CTAYLR_001152 [Chrysophaeum taylorii]|uniref:Uncharacterized protein n=1 Tax=Chrysophaeum taylorii TaxID=2483200 RepID=A0AAD7UQP8_9STRA|nr:hypothetical protein CTAYLR_001152 [Chrysophaeum taylorii]
MNLRFIFAARVVEVVGARDLVVLVAVRGLFEGVVRIWTAAAWPYWLNAHGGVGARRREVLFMMVVVPWGFRSLATVALGPLRRWRAGRAACLATLQTAMICAALVMGRAPAPRLSPELAMLCSIVFELARMSHVVVQDGILAAAVREHPNDAPSVTSVFVLTKNAFSILGLPTIGLALANWPVQFSYSPCLVFLAATILVLVAPALRDDDPHQKDYALARREENAEDASIVDARRLVLAAIFCAAGSTATSALSLLGVDPVWGLLLSAAVAAAGSALVAFAVGSKPARVNFYVVVVRMFAVDLNAARWLYLTDDPVAFPRGPHLRPFFFTTVLAYVGNACTFLAVLLYKRCFGTWRWRTFFRFTATLAFFGQLLSLPVFLRVFASRPSLDAAFVLAEESFNMVVEHLADIPWYLLVASSAPPGADFHVMGLCGAARHLADPVQLYGGVILLRIFGVNPDATDDARDLHRYWQVHLARASVAFVAAWCAVNLTIPTGVPPGKR